MSPENADMSPELRDEILKKAVAVLIKYCGGSDSASMIGGCRVARQTLATYASFDEKHAATFMPIDVLAALLVDYVVGGQFDKNSGYLPVLSDIAEITGVPVVFGPASDHRGAGDSDIIIAQASMGAASADFLSAMGEALSDDALIDHGEIIKLEMVEKAQQQVRAAMQVLSVVLKRAADIQENTSQEIIGGDNA